VDSSIPGVIIIAVMGQKVELRYNKDKFTSHVEKIELNDNRLSNVWGEEIFRITLKENNISPKSKHEFVIIKK